MVTPRRTLIATAFVLVAAPTAFASPTDDNTSSPQPAPPSLRVRPADGCGTRQVNRHATNPEPTPAVFAAGGPRTIWLNRFGGTYHVGTAATNSVTNNASSDITANGNTTIPNMVIPPMSSDFNWTAIVACVKQAYQPYNVIVTETEPPATSMYIEAVVGGDGTEVGFSPGELFGVASADNFCGVTERGIAFSFSETHRDVGRRDEELCATIAHEVGHLITLEHEVLAADMMSYTLVAESPNKLFNNVASRCGVGPGQFNACSCSASGNTTNSGARLTSSLGLRATETVPPTITLESPAADARVAPSFEVVAHATDNMAMEGVTVLLNGLEVGSDITPDGDTYRVTINGANLGAYTLVARAIDQAGNMADATVRITIAKLAFGETCGGNADCDSGTCVDTEASGNFCSETCDPADDQCPDDYDCNAASGTCLPHVTTPGDDDDDDDDDGGDSGGCSTSGGGAAGAGLLAFAIGALVIRRRRK